MLLLLLLALTLQRKLLSGEYFHCLKYFAAKQIMGVPTVQRETEEGDLFQ